jgi:hypothetical protein
VQAWFGGRSGQLPRTWEVSCSRSGQNTGLSGGDPPNPPCGRRGRTCDRPHRVLRDRLGLALAGYLGGKTPNPWNALNFSMVALMRVFLPFMRMIREMMPDFFALFSICCDCDGVHTRLISAPSSRWSTKILPPSDTLLARQM